MKRESLLHVKKLQNDAMAVQLLSNTFPLLKFYKIEFLCLLLIDNQFQGFILKRYSSCVCGWDTDFSQYSERQGTLHLHVSGL